MKLKYFYAVLLVVLAVVVVRAFWPSGPARTLPQHFELSERVLWKLTTTLDAQAGGDNLGTVSAEMLSLTRSFVFKDNTGAVAATGSVGMFT